MPPKKRSAYAKSRDDGEESPQASKRTKTTATVLDGKKCTDDEGNPYWEVCTLPPIPGPEATR